MHSQVISIIRNPLSRALSLFKYHRALTARQQANARQADARKLVMFRKASFGEFLDQLALLAPAWGSNMDARETNRTVIEQSVSYHMLPQYIYLRSVPRTARVLRYECITHSSPGLCFGVPFAKYPVDDTLVSRQPPENVGDADKRRVFGLYAEDYAALGFSPPHLVGGLPKVTRRRPEPMLFHECECQRKMSPAAQETTARAYRHGGWPMFNKSRAAAAWRAIGVHFDSASSAQDA